MALHSQLPFIFEGWIFYTEIVYKERTTLYWVFSTNTQRTGKQSCTAIRTESSDGKKEYF